MKQLTFFILCSFIASVSAQPVIEENDVMVVGTTAEYSYQLFPEVTAGQPGPDQEYNMAGVGAEWTYTSQVVQPMNSPFGTTLPGNRVLLHNGGLSGASYLARLNGILQLNGLVSPDLENENAVYREAYVPPMRLASFPLEYGQEFDGSTYHSITFFVGMDLGTGWVTDSVRRRTTDVYEYEVDGWGSLATPEGEYTVLRQRMHILTYDTVDYYRADLNVWVPEMEILESENVEYTFWSDNHPFPVAKMLDVDGDDFIDDCVWISQTATHAPEVEAVASLQVYPNPGSGLFQIRNAPQSADWTLHDLQGRELKTGRFTSPQASIDLSDLPSGLYLLRCAAGGRVQTHKVVLDRI